VILGQQAGHGLEFPEIQSEDCLRGHESPGRKELKRVNINILPNSAFGCPTHDLHGFSLVNSSSERDINLLALERASSKIGKATARRLAYRT
jgi:hypothetical protein